MAKKASYDNESIQSLKGADRVRKRPGVIFGSDGIEGCEHSVFEILSNSIDEAREGRGDKIIITRFEDGSVEIQDFGAGIPVDYNKKEERYNWELCFCELYAGGKYKTNEGEGYEYSLGLNGLGLCATQYAAEYMDVEIFRDGHKYNLRFEKGENIGGLMKEPTTQKKTGSRIRWKPDLDVFTEIAIPESYFTDVMRRQAVVNGGLTLNLKYQNALGEWSEHSFLYPEGILDYVRSLAGVTAQNEENAAGGKPACLTLPEFWQGERRGKDREDKSEYDVRMEVSFCFSAHTQRLEYYHNSSWLEHGGSPEKAVKSSFLRAIDGYLKNNGKYNKNESKITFVDVED